MKLTMYKVNDILVEGRRLRMLKRSMRRNIKRTKRTEINGKEVKRG